MTASVNHHDADAVDSGPVSLRVRDVHFDMTSAPLHWISGYPVASHTISSYHLLIPEVERFFIVAFKEALPHVRDKRLREDMLGFIGQEAVHAEAHDIAVRDFLQRHGIDVTPVLDQITWMLQKTLGPRIFKSADAQRAYLAQRLAFIAAAECFTAFLGDFALNNSWDEYGADPDVADMLRWHGAEEMEHRAVAHDVACYFDPSYLLRLRTMLLLFPAFLLMTARLTGFVVRADPTARRSRARMLWDFFRSGQRGLLPTLPQVLKAAYTYLRHCKF